MKRSGVTGPWGALAMRIPAVLEDLVVGALGGGALGVDVAFDAPDRVRMLVYRCSAEEAAASLPAAAALLHAHGADPADCGLRVETILDEHWVERWQAGLRPQPLGRGFVVIPHARAGTAKRDRSGRIPLYLVPGMAFGTGEHPTTRLCAAALERTVVPGSAWLDLGTGSGILALVALHCGAARVVAVDSDRTALEVARATLEANGAGDTVELRLGSADEAAGADLDGVVANVAAPFFLSEAARVRAMLAPGGRLLASGLLLTDLPVVRLALEGAGFRVTGEEAEGPWGLLAAERARSVG